MFERLERSAGATMLVIALVLAIAVVLNVVFALPTEIHGFLTIAAIGIAILLAAAHNTTGGNPVHTRHRR